MTRDSTPPTPKTKKRRKRKSGIRLLGLSAFALLLILVATAVTVGWIDRKIHARLAQIRDARAIPIYSDPLTLRTGQPIPLFRVWHYLTLAREGGMIPSPPQMIKPTRTIHFSLEDGREAEIAWDADEHISDLMRIDKGRGSYPVSSLTFPPLFLGSIEDGAMIEYRPIGFDKISQSIKTTFLLSEDSRFFSSPALDLRGIGRAFFRDLRAHRFKEGGSTITQQVVKILFLSRKKSIGRKLEEAILAIRMAALLPPQEIFDLYLNHIDLGGYGTERIVGVEAASLRYFGRHASELGWKEAATLAALNRAPTYYSPFLHPNRTKKLRDRILALLYRHQILDQKTWAALTRQPLGMIEPRGLFHPIGPYFLDSLARRERRIPPPVAPAALHTTMDPLLQEQADRIVPAFIKRLEKYLPPRVRKSHPQALEAALVVMDPRTGAIRAMVGGRDFASSPLNRVTRSRRQPASLFKIVPYLTALSPRGSSPPVATLASSLPNTPLHLFLGHKRWIPKNDEYDAAKSVLLYKALARSMNLPVLHLTETLDKQAMVDTARKLGLETPGPSRIPMSYPLGVVAQTPLQMATAYSRIANGGFSVSPSLISSSGGKDLVSERIFSPGPVYLLWSGLHRVLEEGTAAAFMNTSPGREGWAGKTGTANRGRDAWFVAISSREVVLAWVGFDDDTPTYRFGAQLALPIVSSLLTWQGGVQPSPPTPPPDIIMTSVDEKSGLRGDPACGPSLVLPFLAGTEPAASCTQTMPTAPENPILHFFRQFF